MSMGGRIAEELEFNEITSGAKSDIEHATKFARSMVCEWGMSDKLGPLAFGEEENEVFLGREFASGRGTSPRRRRSRSTPRCARSSPSMYSRPSSSDREQAGAGSHRRRAARVGNAGRGRSGRPAPGSGAEQEQASAGAEAGRDPPARGEGEVEDPRRPGRAHGPVPKTEAGKA